MSPTRLKTIHKLFEIVDLLLEYHTLTASEISDKLDTPLTTVHGYLATMEELGYITQSSGGYEISLKFLEIGARTKENRLLLQKAKPEIQELAWTINEPVVLFVEEGGMGVVLYHVQGNPKLNIDLHEGVHRPLPATTTGVIFLADMSESRCQEILEGYNFDSISEKNDLAHRVKNIDLDGSPVIERSHGEGAWVAAIPIMTENKLYGVLGVMCPTKQLKWESYKDELKSEAINTCNAIEFKLSNIPSNSVKY